MEGLGEGGSDSGNFVLGRGRSGDPGAKFRFSWMPLAHMNGDGDKHWNFRDSTGSPSME